MKKGYLVLTLAALTASLLVACEPGQTVPEGWFATGEAISQEGQDVPDATGEAGTAEAGTEVVTEPQVVVPETEAQTAAPETEAPQVEETETEGFVINDGTGNGYFEIFDRDGQAPEDALFSDITGEEKDYVRVYVIRAKREAFDVKLERLTMAEDTETFTLVPYETVVEFPVMQAGEYFLLNDMIPEGFPTLRVSWKEADGTERGREIYESGMDGALMLLDSAGNSGAEIAIDEEGLKEALRAFVNWDNEEAAQMQVKAAAKLLYWAAFNSANTVNVDYMLQEVLGSFDEATRAEFFAHWEGIFELADKTVNDRESVRTTYETAGCAELLYGVEQFDWWTMMDEWKFLSSKISDAQDK